MDSRREAIGDSLLDGVIRHQDILCKALGISKDMYRILSPILTKVKKCSVHQLVKDFTAIRPIQVPCLGRR